MPPCETVFHRPPKAKAQSATVVQQADPEPLPVPDWSDWSVSELKARCKELKLKGYSKLSREELENLLTAEGATPSDWDEE